MAAVGTSQLIRCARWTETGEQRSGDPPSQCRPSSGLRDEGTSFYCRLSSAQSLQATASPSERHVKPDGSRVSMDMWFVDEQWSHRLSLRWSHRRIQVRKTWQNPTSTLVKFAQV
ncbi:uncharacterized protein LOC117301688 [Asterias rubens]|uniref:uncharacterized protein LOC117301688 n=1 Tax=Asterias rubens TaxID=7604 RepID=UPI0014556254|nr:uncharacterized protein LOC117301688 [Asterias rubens]